MDREGEEMTVQSPPCQHEESGTALIGYGYNTTCPYTVKRHASRENLLMNLWKTALQAILSQLEL
jgi:hypothetical protein